MITAAINISADFTREIDCFEKLKKVAEVQDITILRQTSNSSSPNQKNKYKKHRKQALGTY